MITNRAVQQGAAANGVLLLNKPAGITSNAALQRVRRALGRIKAGHTGTLDPMATGLLPICLGEATKFAHGLLEADKTYEAVIRLGIATDSGDSEGQVVFRGDVTGLNSQVGEVLKSFRGRIEQVPPMFSALKRHGRPLYEYARKGEYVEREGRSVEIYEIELSELRMPYASIRLRCSKGTYVRTLAHDVGDKLGCGAHLVALCRTAIGTLSIEDSIALDVLEEATDSWQVARVLPSDVLLSHLPILRFGAVEAQALLHGRSVITSNLPLAPGAARLYATNGTFLGVGFAHADGQVVPKRMCSEPLAVNAAGAA